jgi:UPF0755 protein
MPGRPSETNGGVLGKVIGFLLALVLLAGASAAGALFYGQYLYEKPGAAAPDGKPRIVLVDKGATAQSVGKKLKADGAIEDELQFRTIFRVLGMLPGEKPVLKAGEYDIAPAASMKDIITQISEGKASNYVVVVPEGLTSAMIIDLLEAESWNTTNEAWRPTEAEIAEQRAQYAALSDDEKRKRKFRAKWGRTVKLEGPRPEEPAEGVLLPGDYAVQPGDTIASVVDRMIKARQKLMNDLWAGRQPGLPFDTPEEAITLASIVEKETGVATERPQVASIFVNRLRRGIKLESDPTIIYGLTKGQPLGRGILRSELDRKNPYSTYQIDGLPPTPICNPGRASIEAVLDPPVTDALFFVADGSGGHAFAATYAEHLRNVAKWREVEASAAAALANSPVVATKP